MGTMRRGRLLGAGLLAMAVAGVWATPAAAGGAATRWVDDDGHAGPQGCGGSHTARKRIQKAVDASDPGDTVKVCPGTYTELVTIAATAGLTLTGVKPWGAIVKPPLNVASVRRSAQRPAGLGDGVINVTSDRVTVRWLKIVTPSTGACDFTGNGVAVLGAHHVSVRGNRIVNQDGPGSRNCGLYYGVVFGNATGQVAYNLIRDFRYDGVLAVNSNVRVIHNSIRFWHLHASCFPAACLRAADRAARAFAEGRAWTGARVSPAGGPQYIGIATFDTTAIIRGNHIESAPQATGPYSGDQLESGIASSGAHWTVTGNTIRRVRLGMYPAYGTTGSIVGNTIRGGDWDGIWINTSDGMVVADNDVHNQDGIGMHVSIGALNNVHDNDFSGNGSTDCVDQTGNVVLAADPIDNTWTNDIGDEDIPDGICTPAP